MLVPGDGAIRLCIWRCNGATLKTAELLLAKGADVNAKSGDGSTPLDKARTFRREEITELLLARGARGMPKTADADVFFRALRRGDLVKAKTLLKDDPDLAFARDKTSDDETALHLAAKGGYKDVAELLLAAGAEVDAKSDEGKTPLWSAAGLGGENMVELLLARGANVNAKDSDNWTPLDRAAAKDEKGVVELLRQHEGKPPRTQRQNRAHLISLAC